MRSCVLSVRNCVLTWRIEGSETRTYGGALAVLEHTKLASPMYLIVGGLEDGTVITRDRIGLARASQDTSFFGRQPVPTDGSGAVRNITRPGSRYFEVETNWYARKQTRMH